ncbi:acyl-ACP desaturase [Mycolicibacter sp. MYC123]|uniref:Acyl-ACP desaturase n=1 Tax=[Mycobacterium] zoologicum TaxID=2872311 RepID=A0ABU5YS73_9MYCO|nr:acyl-ACP desaturase [Mycolicibacter sp. MYC123]MEB3051578.1 acyl-ACP desaturase [Mycolicibacter sp. MYC123]
MAERPVANALIRELEPVVDANLVRHIDTVDPWFAHDYVPFEQGRNFAFLGGTDWDPSQVSLPKVIAEACEILLVEKDSLAGYHRELVEHFILEDKWGRWIGRWTAEEHLHAIALREYLMVTRDIDPDANERVRMEHVQKGYRADHFSQVETLVFMAFYESACAEFCRNLADKTEEPVLKGLIGRIAADEERHEEFFANLVTHCLDFVPEETVAAIAARAADVKVVGAEIDAYADRQAGIAEAGIFGPDQLRRVVSDRISAWGLAANPDLKGFAIS